MKISERRTEIIRILLCRRRETMSQLAHELGVTTRTIRSDITALTVEYPLEPIRGNGGGVRIAKWYKPHKTPFCFEHEQALVSAISQVDEKTAAVLNEILTLFGK